MAKFSGINRAYSTDKEEQTPQEKQRKLDELMKQFLEEHKSSFEKLISGFLSKIKQYQNEDSI